MLDIVPSCNLVQYQGNKVMEPWENGKNSKLMNQTWKNDEKPNFVLKIFFVGFTSTSNYTLFQAIIQYNLKEN